jgi:hypothetical protein
MKRGLEAYERELLKERFSVGRKPRTKRRAENEQKRVSNVDVESSDTRASNVDAETANVESSDMRALNVENPDTRAFNGENPGTPVSDVESSGTRAFSSEGPIVKVGAPKSQLMQSAKRSRHVAAAVARDVYVRDEGRCTFVSSDGDGAVGGDFSRSTTSCHGRLAASRQRRICGSAARRTIRCTRSSASGAPMFGLPWRERAQHGTVDRRLA